MRCKAIISVDIVAYTSLTSGQKRILEKRIFELFELLQKEYDVYIRLVKGDYLECLVFQPEKSLEIALLIKMYIKSLDFKNVQNDNRLKYFNTYGIRLAIGIGQLERIDIEKGIIDGEAIYRAGRLLQDQNTHAQKKIHIKQSLFFASGDINLDKEMDAFCSLLDYIANKATGKQAKVIYYKILKKKEEEIARLMQISRSVVNRQSVSAGWHAIKKAINIYPELINKCLNDE